MFKKRNFGLFALIGAGIVLFILVAFIIIRNTASVTAIVPIQDIEEGTIVTSDMVTEIAVPKDTPTGFITDKNSIIGQKLRVSVGANQLLYIGDVMTSWEEIIGDTEIPDNYVITSMAIPSERAVGGLITAGDTVDILGVPTEQYRDVPAAQLNSYLGDVGTYDSYGAEGVNIYWILANVKILETDSTLSSAQESSISVITGEETGGNSNDSYYIVALSYPDYLKLRLCENYLNFWLSIVPNQNEENGPLYNQMRQTMIKQMVDSQNQDSEYIESQGEFVSNFDPNQELSDIETTETTGTEETEENTDSSESDEKEANN